MGETKETRGTRKKPPLGAEKGKSPWVPRGRTFQTNLPLPSLSEPS